MEIDIDDLVIDDTNIRKELSEDDVQDLTGSLKNLGVLQNLIVRPINTPNGVKYGIVCGSRRYLAAIKAGLKTLPCKILELDDIAAMGLSLTENEGRKNIPTWRTIEWIGLMKQKLGKTFRSSSRLINTLSKKSSLSQSTIKKYLKINKLPPSLKILLKDPEDRSIKENELIKKYVPFDYFKIVLTLGVAELVVDNLLQIEEVMLFQHAIELTQYPYDIVKEIVKILRKNPQKSIDEIVNSIIKKSLIRTLSIQLNKELYDELGKMCVDRRIKLRDLITNLIKEGLKSY